MKWCSGETTIEAPHNFGFYQCGMRDEENKVVYCKRCKERNRIVKVIDQLMNNAVYSNEVNILIRLKNEVEK